MAATTDLWGDLRIETIRTPAAILKEQAALLSEKTRGLLMGRVSSHNYLGNFYHAFEVVVPALDDYSYSLFQIDHEITIYPVSAEGVKLQNESAFEAWLASKLSAPDTRKIIASLLSQASA